MNRDLYSNTEFQDLKKRLNAQIQRRGTYRWWDPLTTPAVGQDRSAPYSLPASQEQVLVDERTYTVNTRSTGSIEPVKNDQYPNRGDTFAGTPAGEVPTTSAARLTVDEMRNFIVGLSKIQDINLFYGRDEIDGLAFRDPYGIEDAIKRAERSILNSPLHQSDNPDYKIDPNQGLVDRKTDTWPQRKRVEYGVEVGEAGEYQYVLPSGETDGEEGVPNEHNFFDDHGADAGDGNYHPYNPAYSEIVDRSWKDFDNDRNIVVTNRQEGGVPSSIYGSNPRNPNPGSPYRPRPAYGGREGSCNVACTGLCYQTCDNECTESCTTTCWNRCGNACTSSCGNECTGCSSMCYTSCRTKCENIEGYSCLKAGAKTVQIFATGGHDGIPAENHLEYTTHTCEGCSYTCQFYPNKKTTCWDAGCMGKCFTSCFSSCSTSCFGGCVDNESENTGDYRTGKGRGCQSGCTINCVGECEGVCEGMCTYTCYHACKQLCSDNCSWKCYTTCGSGCSDGCKNDCKDTCVHNADATTCEGGCTAACQHDCNANCMGVGCRSICGTDSAGACSNNCRISCEGTSCTSLCSDACSSTCTSCVHTCGFQCGACSSLCSSGCEEVCNITCSADCEHSCSSNCVYDCSEECGGCSNLCYSCVGMCIGVCSVKCENGCTNCANECTWWCDVTCGTGCASNCSDRCISTCIGSCSTLLTSDSKMTEGPEREPTSEGYKYPNPQNRYEERDSFLLYHQPDAETGTIQHQDGKIIVEIDDKTHDFIITTPEGIMWVMYATSLVGGVFDINQETGEITIREEMLIGASESFDNNHEGGVSDVNLEIYDSSKYENHKNLDGGWGLFVIVFSGYGIEDISLDEIEYRLPIRFEAFGIQRLKTNDIAVVIQYHREDSEWTEE